MDYKGQTVVLSAIFVLVGTMFVVPAITEKALAIVKAQAYYVCTSHGLRDDPEDPCIFHLVPPPYLKAGAHWVREPSREGNVVEWQTEGSGGAGVSDEDGYVRYKVGGGLVDLVFSNPGSIYVRNTCEVKILSGPVSGTCEAGRGSEALFKYTLHEK